MRILERDLRLTLLDPKPNNRCPKLNSKINKTAKKIRAYETFCTGSVKSKINVKPKKLPADKIAGSTSCGLRCFTLPLYIKTKSTGGKCAH